MYGRDRFLDLLLLPFPDIVRTQQTMFPFVVPATEANRNDQGSRRERNEILTAVPLVQQYADPGEVRSADVRVNRCDVWTSC